MAGFHYESFKTGSMVTLLIGADKTTFQAHENVLHNSDFFKKALTSGFRESITKVIKLPEDHPRTVHYLLQWLYSGSLPDITSIAADGDHDSASLCLAKIWILAEKLMLPKLQDAALRAIHDHATNRACNAIEVDADTLKYAWKRTSPDSIFRMFLIRLVASHKTTTTIEQLQSSPLGSEILLSMALDLHALTKRLACDHICYEVSDPTAWGGELPAVGCPRKEPILQMEDYLMSDDEEGWKLVP